VYKCDDCGEIVCEQCGTECEDVAGCVEEPLAFVVHGQVCWYEPVRYGAPRERWDGSPPEHCHDCFAEPGRAHHWGCDMAVCPRCGGQFLGCDCELADVEPATRPEAQR
jgi:site-specific DNA recombinase